MTRDEFLLNLGAQIPGYLRIDNDPSEMMLLDAMASASVSWVESGVGAVDWSDGRVMLLSLAAVADFYDQRGLVTRGNTNFAVRENTRRMMEDLMLQLRLGGGSSA